MTVRFEGGALIVRRPTDNAVRFNSNEGLFHGTNYYSGTASLGSYSAVSGNVGGEATSPSLVNATTNNDLGAAASGATHVFGFMRSNGNTGGGVNAGNDGLWRDASGTQVESWLYCDNRAPSAITSGDQHTFMTHMGCMSLLTFYVSGGRLYLKERIVMRASNVPVGGANFTLTRPAITIDYRLLAGYFL